MLVLLILAKWWINTDAVAYGTSKSAMVQLFGASTQQAKIHVGTE
jgi:predicted metalloendopeptidase